jgi:NADH-quinone oxidoreductase subunit D
VCAASPIIGYLQTGMEKQAEYKTYTQSIPQTDRMDYLAPMSNNLAFCLARRSCSASSRRRACRRSACC